MDYSINELQVGESHILLYDPDYEGMPLTSLFGLVEKISIFIDFPHEWEAAAQQ